MEKLVRKLYEKNIKVHLENGNLRLNIPKGIDVKDILEEVKENKQKLIDYIGRLDTKKTEIDLDHQQMLNIVDNLKPQQTYDASHQQKKEYLRYLINGKYAFNIVFQVELQNIQKEIVEKTIQALFERHEILRTTFLTEKKSIKQKVHLNIPEDFSIEYIDLTASENKEEMLSQEFKESEDRLFDFEKGPLISIKVITVSPKVQGFLISMHHAISDQETTHAIRKEIQMLYALFQKGDEPSFVPLKIQSKEHAFWVNNYLTSDIGLKRTGLYKEKIWQSLQLDKNADSIKEHNYKKKLSEELAIALKGKDTSGFPDFFGHLYNLFPNQGASYQVFIENGKVEKLNEMLKHYNCSFFSLLISLFAIAFYKKDRNESVRIFIPYSGRIFEEFKDLLGWLSCEMITCIAINEELSVKELTKNVSDTILETLHYSVYPHEKIMQDFDISLDVLSPLFLNLSRINESYVGEMKPRHFNRGSGHFTMASTISQYDNGIKLNVDYNTKYFSSQQVENLIKDYTDLIDSLFEKPNVCIKELFS